MLKEVISFQNDDDHIITMLDHFTLRGPNCLHLALVMEVVIPIDQLLSSKCLPSWRKTIAHQMAQAVAHVHAAGIAHGGTYTDHFGSQRSYLSV